jgi:hypothetical protein
MSLECPPAKAGMAMVQAAVSARKVLRIMWCYSLKIC